MRLAICNETFQHLPLEEGFRIAHLLGYEGIEFAPFTLGAPITEITATALASVKELANQFELSITGLHWLLAKVPGVHLTSPNPAIREVTLNYLIALVRACSALSGSVLVFGSPAQRNIPPNVDFQEAWSWARSVFCRVAQVAEDHGVTFCLEPLSPTETNLFASAAEAARMVKEIDHPSFRLILDVKAMASEGTPIPEIVRRNAQLLAYFHANDANKREPGSGTIDFVPILRTLREAGYSGWISIEVFDYTPDPITIAQRGIGYLRDALSRSRT